MFQTRAAARVVSIFTLLALSSLAPVAAQSTANIQGSVTDASGAVVPNAVITIRNVGTGEDRTTTTDESGSYNAASLAPGTYRIEVKASGLQTMVATGVPLEVGRTVRQDFSLKVATASEVVEITGAAPVIESSTIAVSGVVNQRTVQEIPLNGRHFVDLALLIPGTVTPPQNGFLTAPLRGQGSFAFNTAGAREDQVNFMINGINLERSGTESDHVSTYDKHRSRIQGGQFDLRSRIRPKLRSDRQYRDAHWNERLARRSL